MVTMGMELDEARELDRTDPLAGFRDRFVRDDHDGDRELVYLDGNSLGRLPVATVERLRSAVRGEWGGDLIRGWDRWMDLGRECAALLGGPVLDAAPEELALSDSTSVNLYKLAVAALAARPDRRVVVVDRDNFPTDRYILQQLAADRGLELRELS